MFSVDQVGLLGDGPIVDERRRFDWACDLIEKFASEHRLVMGGNMAEYDGSSVERTQDDYVYEVYSDDALLRSNDLANLLARSQRDFRLVMLKTVVLNRRFVVFIDGRPMVTFVQADNLDLLAGPVRQVFGNKQRLLSPEIRLIDVYRTLYSPEEAGEWDEVLKSEVRMFKGRGDGGHGDDKGRGHRNVSDSHVRVERYVLNYATDNPKVVLVGEHAAFMLGAVTAVTDHIVELVAADANAVVREIVDALRSKGTVAKFTFGRTNLPNDGRSARFTIKYEVNSTDPKKTAQDKDVCYLYNSGEYSLIPFTKHFDGEKTLLLGNVFVIMRFLLVGLFVLRKIMTMAKVDEGYYRRRSEYIMDLVNKLRRMMTVDKTAVTLSQTDIKRSGLVIFQETSDSYIGTYVDEKTANKALAVKKRVGDYFPTHYLLHKGSYRVIDGTR